MDFDPANWPVSRPALFFKSTCPPCRGFSRLAVLFSFGLIRRVPINSAEAKMLYRKYPAHEGQLVLIENQRITFGLKVFLAVPRVIASTPLYLLTSLRGTPTDIAPDAGRRAGK